MHLQMFKGSVGSHHRNGASLYLRYKRWQFFMPDLTVSVVLLLLKVWGNEDDDDPISPFFNALTDTSK